MRVSKEVYTVAEVSRQTVTRMFEREKGVLILARESLRKRSYRSIRIPRAVYERVIERLKL